MENQVIWSAIGVLPDAAREIRIEVFVLEQGFLEEFDDLDCKSYHAVGYDGHLPYGTARLFWECDHVMHLGRVALRQTARGRGHGRSLVLSACKRAWELGAQSVVLGAQLRAKGFYESCGFTVYGEPFDDEGCPHIMMRIQKEG